MLVEIPARHVSGIDREDGKDAVRLSLVAWGVREFGTLDEKTCLFSVSARVHLGPRRRVEQRVSSG